MLVESTCPTSKQSNWLKLLIWYAAGLVVLFATYFDAFATMAYAWWNISSYTHGLLILPISIYLVWERRNLLSEIGPEPSVAGLWVIFCTFLFWCFAYLADIQLFIQISFFAFWIGLTLAVLGVTVFRLCLFPLFYLFFAVPVGQQLVQPMMDVTVSFAVSGLALTNIPFYFEGRLIHLPTGSWQVVEACSGVRYILASLALGSLYAYLNYQKPWKRAVFMIVAFVLPILANGLRAFTLILLGHYSNMAFGAGGEHVTYGLFFYALIMLALFWAGSFWKDEQPKLQLAYSSDQPSGRPIPNKTFFLGVPMLAIILIGSGSGARIYLDDNQFANIQYSTELPLGQSGWRGPIEQPVSWDPSFPGAALTQSLVYTKMDESVLVFIVHFGQQRQGQELISHENHLFQRKVWRKHGGDLRRVGIDIHPQFEKNLYQSGHAYRVVAWSYDVQNVKTTNMLYGKLLEVWARINKDHSGSSLIAIAVESSDSPEEADHVLNEFLKQNPDFLKNRNLVSIADSPMTK